MPLGAFRNIPLQWARREIEARGDVQNEKEGDEWTFKQVFQMASSSEFWDVRHGIFSGETEELDVETAFCL